MRILRSQLRIKQSLKTYVVSVQLLLKIVVCYLQKLTFWFHSGQNDLLKGTKSVVYNIYTHTNIYMYILYIYIYMAVILQMQKFTFKLQFGR